MANVSAWSETLSINKKRVVEEPFNGQECANQLQILFHNWSRKSERLSAVELVHKIFTSFNYTLSMLTSQNQPTPTSYNGCPQHSTKTWNKRPACKDNRGCYKRRGYFRCTRKYDQGCKATKQVQRIDDDDSRMYQITYIGTHTCRLDSTKAPRIIKDSESWESDKVVTYGNSKIQSKKLHEPRFNPYNTPIVKQEAKEETMTTSGVTGHGFYVDVEGYNRC